jgi:hypothetical protein
VGRFVDSNDYGERDILEAAIKRSEQWPFSRDKLLLKYYENVKRFTDNIVLNKE